MEYTIVSLALMASGFWQKKIWIFFVAGTSWVVEAIYAFQNNPSNTEGWAFGWIYVMTALACIISPMWLEKKRD